MRKGREGEEETARIGSAIERSGKRRSEGVSFGVGVGDSVIVGRALSWGEDGMEECIGEGGRFL